MYATNIATGETWFRCPARGAARSVILEAVTNQQPLRVRMQRQANEWIAKLKLPAGWCFYRFEVDGKTQWDRAAGKMKTRDGRPCSLALITNGSKEKI